MGTEATNVWTFGPQSSLAAGFLYPPEPEPLRPRDPERVGGYTLVGRLGAGGMGVAYLARDDAGREVALKRVHAGLAEHEEFRARFIREVAAARRVPGRHTARVVDADVLADPPWLATEYFRCWTLAQQVPRFGSLTVENAGTLIARLAEALAAIHAAGLVHRDLKPSNILLAPDGPRIIDFGIARAADLAVLNTTGGLHGTPGYMAPEQIEGHETGPPVDVFALGACLVYATAGTSPFWDGSPTTLMYRTVHAEPDLVSMPEELREVVLRCLTKEAEGRPTAAELAAEFAEYSRQDQVQRQEPDDVPAEEQRKKPAQEAIDVTEADRSENEAAAQPEAPAEHNVIDGTTVFIPEKPETESRQNIVFPPSDRRPRTGLVIATTAGGLVAAAAVALALATNSGSAAAPPARASTSQPSITTRSHPSTSVPNTTSPRSASAIPGQPPPLPRTLVGYSGRLLGANLAWFESLQIPASSAPWSAGGPWTAIAGPGCPDGVGHSLSASTGWSPDPAHGGAAFGGCGDADLVVPTVAPGQTATATVTWTFTPGPAVSECALFAYNATGPANLAFGDYSTAGRGGQFPMSGASHAGEWVELGIAAPAADGTLSVGIGNDQPTDAERPPGPTVTAAQVVAVCGGPSV
ncbi:protein kinase domain-containing protein [Catenulispora rubra]|uniref:protein kinase domain-containing protein n=1 Tax=Catenulispora rubra TaxID=280293 RepID=UPI00189281A2|nr:serine/threonine-protein kinase [Catenulispora rubra]